VVLCVCVRRQEVGGKGVQVHAKEVPRSMACANYPRPPVRSAKSALSMSGGVWWLQNEVSEGRRRPVGGDCPSTRHVQAVRRPPLVSYVVKRL